MIDHAGSVITAAHSGVEWGVPPALSVGVVAVFLAGLVLTGSYRSVERVAIALG